MGQAGHATRRLGLPVPWVGTNMHDRPRSFGRNASSLRAVRDEPVFLALDQRPLPIIAYFRRSTAVRFTAMLSGSLRTNRPSFLGRKACAFTFARVFFSADKKQWVTMCSAKIG